MAKVGLGGVSHEVCRDYVPETQAGQYCLTHVGFAISLWSEEEALETLDLLKQVAPIEEDIRESG